jgi:hypothetical protein
VRATLLRIGTYIHDSLKCKNNEKENLMHYKNGREARNGDKVMLLAVHGPPVIGILYDATAGNDYCNGKIAPILPSDACPNLKECLHLDDVIKALPAEVPDSSTAL